MVLADLSGQPIGGAYENRNVHELYQRTESWGSPIFKEFQWEKNTTEMKNSGK